MRGFSRERWPVRCLYGPHQALIHHQRFGDLADRAGRWLVHLLADAGFYQGAVVDRGCGSGILARLLNDAGYEVLGIDISPAMVALARQHAPAATIVEGSLLDAELPAGRVAVTAIGEGLNYATAQRAGLDALTGLASRVVRALEPGGVFLFDVAGPGRNGGAGPVRQVFHDEPGWCLGMRATESGDGTRLDRAVTIFTQVDGDSYRRTDEHPRPQAVRAGRRAQRPVGRRPGGPSSSSLWGSGHPIDPCQRLVSLHGPQSRWLIAYRGSAGSREEILVRL